MRLFHEIGMEIDTLEKMLGVIEFRVPGCINMVRFTISLDNDVQSPDREEVRFNSIGI